MKSEKGILEVLGLDQTTDVKNRCVTFHLDTCDRKEISGHRLLDLILESLDFW